MRSITLNILFAVYAFCSATVIFMQATEIQNIKNKLQLERSESEQQIQLANVKLQDIYDKLQILAGIKV